MNYHRAKAEATRVIRDNKELDIFKLKLLIQTKFGLSGRFVDKTIELIENAEQ